MRCVMLTRPLQTEHTAPLVPKAGPALARDGRVEGAPRPLRPPQAPLAPFTGPSSPAP